MYILFVIVAYHEVCKNSIYKISLHTNTHLYFCHYYYNYFFKRKQCHPFFSRNIKYKMYFYKIYIIKHFYNNNLKPLKIEKYEIYSKHFISKLQTKP